MERRECPNCGSGDQFVGPEVASGGAYAPDLLPGLGRWYRAARLRAVVCRDCGLMRLFASEEARRRLGDSDRWRRWLG